MGSLMMMFLLPGYGVWKTTLSRKFWKEKHPHLWYIFWSSEQYWLAVSNIFYSRPYLWKMNPFWRLRIFQRGWFNHQLEYPSPFFARNLMADLRVKGVKGSCATWLFWSGHKGEVKEWRGWFCLRENLREINMAPFFTGSLMVFQSHDFSGSYVKLRGVIVCLFLRGNIKKDWNGILLPKGIGRICQKTFGGDFNQFHTHFLDEFVCFFSFVWKLVDRTRQKGSIQDVCHVWVFRSCLCHVWVFLVVVSQTKSNRVLILDSYEASTIWPFPSSPLNTWTWSI